MKKLKWVALVALILGLGGAWYGYHEWYREAEDLTYVEPDVIVSSTEIIHAFAENDSLARDKYVKGNKAVEVIAKIISIGKDDKGLYTITVGDESELSAVSCQMDTRHNLDAEKLKVGDEVKIECHCTGSLTDVEMNCCVIKK